MKLKLTVILLLLTSIKVNAQVGTPNYLDQTGIIGLRLGDSITKIPKEQLTFINENQYGFRTYAYTNAKALKLTDNITLEKVEIICGHNKVGEINLFFNKTELAAIVSYFDKMYGNGEVAGSRLRNYSGDNAQLTIEKAGEGDTYEAAYGGPDE